MKKARKGFTLVELLIVVAILATLTATMTYSISGSTAKAKVAMIASNVEACKGAANLYAVKGGPLPSGKNSIDELTADDMLKVALPTWVNFSQEDASGATDKIPIKYAGSTKTGDNTDGKGADNWAIVVDFGDDADKAEIKRELQKIKGYKMYDKDGTATEIMDTGVYKFEVMLMSGKVQPVTTGS